MAEPRLMEILTILTQRTAAGEVTWEKTAAKDTFQTTFVRHTALIEGPISAPRFFLVDEDGDVVEEFNIASGVGARELLSDLFQAARRRALGADEALDDVLRELRNAPRVGKKM